MGENEKYVGKVKIITHCCNSKQIYKPTNKWNGKDYRRARCKICGNLVNINSCMKTIEAENNEYLENIKNIIKEQLKELTKNEKFSYINKTDFMNLCQEYINQIRDKYSNNRSLIYNSLPTNMKGSEYIAGVIIYSVLLIEYEYTIEKKEFIKLIKEEYFAQNFYGVSNFFQKNVFKLNPDEYYNKIIDYSLKYIEIVKKSFNVEIDNIKFLEEVKLILQNLFQNKFVCKETSRTKTIKNIKEIAEILQEDGLNIKKINQNLHYKYLLPNYVAITILYMYILRENKKKGLKNCNIRTISKIVNLNEFKIRVITNLLMIQIEKYWKSKFPYFRYTKTSFKLQLQKICKNVIESDALLVLKLLNILNVELDTFLKTILPTHNKISDITGHLNIANFSYKRIIKIKFKIKELKNLGKITKKQYKKAREIIYETLENKLYRSKLLRSNTQEYLFMYFEKRIKNIDNDILKKQLISFMNNIINDKYPIGMFSNTEKRCSSYVLKGTIGKNKRLNIKTIKKELIEQLISEGKATENSKNKVVLKLKQIAMKKMEDYRKKYGRDPKHPPIEKKTIKKVLEVFGIEVPVWNEKLEIVGHIDILGYDGRDLLIIDYKTKDSEIYRNLVQLCSYAILLSIILDIKVQNIKCIAYTKNISLEFKPTILTDVKKFVVKQNSERNYRLKSLRNKLDIEKSITELIHLTN